MKQRSAVRKGGAGAPVTREPFRLDGRITTAEKEEPCPEDLAEEESCSAWQRFYSQVRTRPTQRIPSLPATRRHGSAVWPYKPTTWQSAQVCLTHKRASARWFHNLKQTHITAPVDWLFSLRGRVRKQR